MGVGYWSVTVGSVGTLVVVAVIWCGGYGAFNWCFGGVGRGWKSIRELITCVLTKPDKPTT